VWYGRATGRWWALPPVGLSVQRLFEGATVNDVVAIIYAIETPASPGESSRSGELPPLSSALAITMASARSATD
jgi:hypothetical protein